MQMATQGVTYSFPVLVPAPGENSGKFGSGVGFLGGGGGWQRIRRGPGQHKNTGSLFVTLNIT